MGWKDVGGTLDLHNSGHLLLLLLPGKVGRAETPPPSGLALKGPPKHRGENDATHKFMYGNEGEERGRVPRGKLTPFGLRKSREKKSSVVWRKDISEWGVFLGGSLRHVMA